MLAAPLLPPRIPSDKLPAAWTAPFKKLAPHVDCTAWYNDDCPASKMLLGIPGPYARSDSKDMYEVMMERVHATQSLSLLWDGSRNKNAALLDLRLSKLGVRVCCEPVYRESAAGGVLRDCAPQKLPESSLEVRALERG